MAGGLASWTGDLENGVVELDKNRNELDPRFEAVPTLDELRGRLDDPELTIIDVRQDEEYRGKSGYPCDPRQGHIPGARHLEAGELFAAPGTPLAPRGDQGAGRSPRGRRDRRVLPLGLALGGRGDGAPLGRLPGAELPRLVARVVTPRRPAGRALGEPPAPAPL